MRLLFSFLLTISFLYADVFSQKSHDIGFVDEITVNDRELDSLNNRDIAFYPEDLKNGNIIIKGILESEDTSVDVKDLYVEITFDGGNSWTRAKGHKEWEWSFKPELKKSYKFSLRVVKKSVTNPPKTTPIIVTTEPVIVKLYTYEPRIVTTEPIVVKLHSYEPRVVTTEPIIVKLRTYEPRVVTTEPVIVKLNTYEPRVVTTEPVVVKLKKTTPKKLFKKSR